jgi:hypothetical protein
MLNLFQHPPIIQGIADQVRNDGTSHQVPCRGTERKDEKTRRIAGQARNDGALSLAN